MWIRIKKELPFFFAVPAVVWQVLFLCVPLLLVLYMSVHSSSEGAQWYMFTLEHYRALLTLTHMHIFFRSLLLATATSFLCLIIGYPVAYFIALHVHKWKELLLFLLTLPFWTNFLTQAYAWFFLLEQYGLINRLLMWLHVIQEPLHMVHNCFGVMCVMVYCYLPFMIMPIYSVLQKMNRQLIEASQDLGATRWQAFYSVTWPFSYKGVQTGILLVFVPAFGEFVIPMIMGGSRYMYVGSTIMHYILNVRGDNLGAAFTCATALLLVCIIGVLIMYVRVTRNAMRKR